jgi:hypothetical protein
MPIERSKSPGGFTLPENQEIVKELIAQFNRGWKGNLPEVINDKFKNKINI